MSSHPSRDDALVFPRKPCAALLGSPGIDESIAPVRSPFASRPRRCGIVLAAGDGTRLRPLIQRLRGKPLPKQYVSFVGTRSLLEHTFSRVESILPPERIFTVVARDHLRYPEARKQLITRPKGRVVVQPSNRDTLPGLLLPLLQLRRLYPDSVVAVFPSDHYIVEEERFMSFVTLAFQEVEQHPEQVVLLGIEPDEPESEYGYLLPEQDLQTSSAEKAGHVRGFVEKPDPARAEELIRSGALWNTMVLVFHTASFLALVERNIPGIMDGFLSIEEALGTPEENMMVEEAYRRMVPLNLSRDLLQALAPSQPARLSVMAVRGVTWSDWGSERRIYGVAQPEPAWRKEHEHATQVEGKGTEDRRWQAIPAAG